MRPAERSESSANSPDTRVGDSADRHLVAVQKPANFLDRRSLPFVPVYLEFVASPKAERPGYGLSGNVAFFYSVLLHLAGTPADGRRQSKAEIEKRDSFVRRLPSAGKLSKMYGWSYDQIDSWSKACAAPRLCPHCKRAHALLRIERRNGHKNAYEIVRCQDLRDDECLAPALVDRMKRIPTGAADPRTRVLRDDPRVGLPGFDDFVVAAGPAQVVENRPAPGSDALRPVLTAAEGRREQDCASTVGQSPMVSLDTSGDRGQVDAAAAGRIRVLEGFAIIERVTMPQTAIEAIALAVEDPTDLYNSLIGVVAAASIAGCAITAEFATAAIEGRRDAEADAASFTAAADQSVEAAGADWAIQRIFDLARKRERGTTLTRARSYHTEFLGNCLARYSGDRIKAESELARVLTDPRCCGAIGKDPPLKPIAMIRSGFRDGWIWTDARSDDGSHQLARAFERDLSRERQAEVERLFRNSAQGTPLDYARLREHRISSKAMIAYLHRRFGTLIAASKEAEPSS